MSSKVILQQQVLSLLAQLIKLRVNYSLLDADQVRAPNKIFLLHKKIKAISIGLCFHLLSSALSKVKFLAKCMSYENVSEDFAAVEFLLIPSRFPA